MNFKLWMEEVVITKKVKKFNIDKEYPFIITKTKVFVGKPTEMKNGKLKVGDFHADITVEFSGKMGRGPSLRGTFRPGEVILIDKEYPVEEFIKPLQSLVNSGLLWQAGKAKIKYYDVHQRRFVTEPLANILNPTPKQQVVTPQAVADPAERQWGANYLSFVANKDKVQRALTNKEQDPSGWFYRYPEGNNS